MTDKKMLALGAVGAVAAGYGVLRRADCLDTIRVVEDMEFDEACADVTIEMQCWHAPWIRYKATDSCEAEWLEARGWRPVNHPPGDDSQDDDPPATPSSSRRRRKFR